MAAAATSCDDAAVSRGHAPISHTADTGVRAWAPGRSALFEECAAGMFETMFSAPVAEPSIDVSATGETVEDLLVGWLSELLYLAETGDLALSAFVVDELGEGRVRGRAGGVAVASAEVTGPPIKAVTYHGLEVRHDGEWHARVIFDV